MLVLLVRGLLSQAVGSQGMEMLHARLPGSVLTHWFEEDALLAQCKAATSPLALVGHSFGANCVIRLCNALATVGRAVCFAGPIDPAQQQNCAIADNVARGISVFNTMPFQLGQGRVVPDDSWGVGEFTKRFSVSSRYETHLQIAEDPVVQDAIYNGVKTCLT